MIAPRFRALETKFSVSEKPSGTLCLSSPRPKVHDVTKSGRGGQGLLVTENGNCLLRAMKSHGGNYRGSNVIRFFPKIFLATGWRIQQKEGRGCRKTHQQGGCRELEKSLAPWAVETSSQVPRGTWGWRP